MLYLINLTAGLLDGDGHKIEITAREGTRAVVTGQSATRIHPAQSHYATQQWSVEVEDDACLVVLPGPAIPYRGSRYLLSTHASSFARARTVDLGRHLAGRPLRPRRFVRAVPVRAHRSGFRGPPQQDGFGIPATGFRWDGPWTPELDARWYFGDAIGLRQLCLSPGQCAGFFAEAGPDLATCMIALSAPRLRRELYAMVRPSSARRHEGPGRYRLRLAACWTIGPDAPPWLLDVKRLLAPNHWFFGPQETSSGET